MERGKGKELAEQRLDLEGSGALNVDVFCSLRSGRTVDQIVPGLRPGGEVIANESEREQSCQKRKLDFFVD